MNDNMENWLCDVTRVIERVVGHVRYDYIEEYVEGVTMQVSQQVRDSLLTDGNVNWVTLAIAEDAGANLMAAAFSRSRLAAEINA